MKIHAKPNAKISRTLLAPFLITIQLGEQFNYKTFVRSVYGKDFNSHKEKRTFLLFSAKVVALTEQTE